MGRHSLQKIATYCHKLTKAITSLLWKLVKGIQVEKHLYLTDFREEQWEFQPLLQLSMVLCQDCKAIRIDSLSIWNAR